MEWNDFFKLLTEYKNSIREHDKNPSIESMDRYKHAYIGMRDAFFKLNAFAQPPVEEGQKPAKFEGCTCTGIESCPICD